MQGNPPMRSIIWNLAITFHDDRDVLGPAFILGAEEIRFVLSCQHNLLTSFCGLIDFD